MVFSHNGNRLAGVTTHFGNVYLWDFEASPVLRHLRTSGGPPVASVFFSERDLLGVLRDQLSAGTPRIATWDLSGPNDELDPASGNATEQLNKELGDQRLKDLVNLMEPKPASPPAGLRDSLCDRPLRGFARTADGTLGLCVHGDGTFTILRLVSELPQAKGRSGFGGDDPVSRLAIGRFDTHGATIVLFGPGKDERSPRQDSLDRLKPLVAALNPIKAEHPSPSDRVIRTDGPGPVAFSPDGRCVAIKRYQRQVEVIERDPGHPALVVDIEGTGASALCFTRDSSTLIMGGDDGLVRLRHLRPRPEAMVLAGHAERGQAREAWSVAFSPDGHTVASAGDDNLIRIWDPSTERELARLEGHNMLVTSIAFAPDSRSLVSGSFDPDSRIILWDLSKKLPPKRLAGHAANVLAVAISPDGHTIASGGRDQIAIRWNADDGRRLDTITEHSDWVDALAFSPDGGILASGGLDRRIVLSDTSTGLSRRIDYADQVFALRFSPDGKRLYSAHHGGAVLSRDIASDQSVTILPGHGSNVRGLAVSPDGQTLATAGDDATVRLYDLDTGQELLCLTGFKIRVNAVAFSPDGMSLAAADHSGAVTIWKARPSP